MLQPRGVDGRASLAARHDLYEAVVDREQAAAAMRRVVGQRDVDRELRSVDMEAKPWPRGRRVPSDRAKEATTGSADLQIGGFQIRVAAVRYRMNISCTSGSAVAPRLRPGKCAPGFIAVWQRPACAQSSATASGPTSASRPSLVILSW